ncbi:histone-fold domain-containing protein [Hamiltosporidium tvaerminnensis]|uniref:Histone-fold domain-containing protein n=1 Tax=Hamiltosporidium tvaerminnensis TaxID=1176355 RepID=A0A4Q9L854_9MICR|nr:histone-fold domain-containing protein [Hamiltosporidium tvaerminnensis]
MKSRFTNKILKLAVAEILIQSSFERCSNSALTILTDIAGDYIMALTKRISSLNILNPESGEDTLIKELISEIMGSSDSYSVLELQTFLETQNNAVTYLKDKLKPKSIDSLLNMLRIVPKIDFLQSQSDFTNSLSEIKYVSVNTEIKVDDFLSDFIQRSANKKEVKKTQIFYEQRFDKPIVNKIYKNNYNKCDRNDSNPEYLKVLEFYQNRFLENQNANHFDFSLLCESNNFNEGQNIKKFENNA